MMLLKVRVLCFKAFTLLVGWIKVCPHCPIFLTAAEHSSGDPFSVPLWLITLSGQLWIIDLVGRYLHQLSIPIKPIFSRKPFFYGIKPKLKVGSFFYSPGRHEAVIRVKISNLNIIALPHQTCMCKKPLDSVQL